MPFWIILVYGRFSEKPIWTDGIQPTWLGMILWDEHLGIHCDGTIWDDTTNDIWCGNGHLNGDTDDDPLEFILLTNPQFCAVATGSGVDFIFFPTSLCGVLVFDSVSRVLPRLSASSPPPPASVTLSTNTHHLSHTQLCHTSSHTYSFTHNFVTHHLSHTTLSYTTLSPLSHTICHTSFVTHHLTHLLSHTTLSHIIFHTQLCHTQLCLRCHTPSFTHTQFCHTSSHTSSFTHTTLSHIIFHKQLCHTSYVTHHLSHIISHIFFHTQLCGRRGTWRHPPSFCVAGVALVALGWLCWRAWTGLVAGDAAAFCLAGAHLATSTLVLRGRRGTWWQYNCVLLGRRATYSTRPALVARLDRISRRWRRGTLRGGRGAWRHLLWFCVAGVALGHIHLRFAWQAWHLWHWTGSGGALGPVLVAGDAGALCVAGVALGDIHLRFAFFHTHHLLHTIFGPQLLHTIFETQLCHTPCLNHHLSHTMFDTPSFTHHVWHTLFHTPSFTHHLVTHHLSHTTLSHTIFHHTILHTPLCHTPSFTTPSFTHNFVAHHLSPHHLSHTTLSHTIFRHTIFHTPLCHIPSFTHNFVTRSLSHTTFTHTIFHTQLCRTHTHAHHLSLSTPSFTYSFVTHNFVLLLDPPPPPLSFLPCPRYNLWCSLLEEVALWGYPVLQLWGKGCIFFITKTVANNPNPLVNKYVCVYYT